MSGAATQGFQAWLLWNDRLPRHGCWHSTERPLEWIFNDATPLAAECGEESLEYEKLLAAKTVFATLATLSSDCSESDPLDEQISKSREILSWLENWDGEGAKAYSEATWQRAVDFLRRQASLLKQTCGEAITSVVPRILPGPEGSIDLLWKTPDYRLLINIPDVATDEVASFYGDDYGNAVIRGTFDPSVENLGLLGWLISH